ncbi:hypothetical protein EVAR_28499_1 [Eumeta japonica]|uniref:Uncharacterized protein n=1 Tax=Eumeta variegata TaxID=151549 RepID=A0A4C1WSR3_EUMVA|nr:hypothetical protein EVAR_28499_1 [Eumeta japonica]
MQRESSEKGPRVRSPTSIVPLLYKKRSENTLRGLFEKSLYPKISTNAWCAQPYDRASGSKSQVLFSLPRELIYCYLLRARPRPPRPPRRPRAGYTLCPLFI